MGDCRYSTTEIRPLAPASEEFLQHFRRAASEHAAPHLHVMVETGMIQDVHCGVYCAGFGIVGAIHKPPDASVDQRASTHRARLDRGKQITIAQAVIAHGGAGLAKSNYFGVGSGIRKGDVAIEAPADDFARMHNHGTDRHFSRFEATLRSPQRFLHPEFVAAKFVVCRIGGASHDEYCSLAPIPLPRPTSGV